MARSWLRWVNVNLKRSEMMFVYANAANDANQGRLASIQDFLTRILENVEKALTDEDKNVS